MKKATIPERRQVDNSHDNKFKILMSKNYNSSSAGYVQNVTVITHITHCGVKRKKERKKPPP